MTEALDQIEAAAQTVRQIRRNLAPRLLEGGLSAPLQALTEAFNRRAGLPVTLDPPAEVDQGLPLEARLALYRVVPQALDNIAAYAEATAARIQLERAADQVRFKIEDDGRGFAPRERQAAQAAGSFGPISMEARLTALGGALAVTSAPGQGTRVQGCWPIPD